jgi:hypothetical protein
MLIYTSDLTVRFLNPFAQLKTYRIVISEYGLFSGAKVNEYTTKTCKI